MLKECYKTLKVGIELLGKDIKQYSKLFKNKGVKMGLSASQGRLLLLTARQTDLEYQAQMVSQQRLALAQKLTTISEEYEDAVNNRQMNIVLYSTDDNTAISPTNLTYAKLVSGCGAVDSSISGLNTVEGINTVEGFACAKALRLTDVTGAIVVSDISEIPGNIQKTSTATPKAQDAVTRYDFYAQKNINIDNITGTTKTITTNYFSLDSISNFTTTDLGRSLSSENMARYCKMVTNGTNYYIEYNGQYYDASGTRKATATDPTYSDYKYETGNGASVDSVKFVYSSSLVPKSVTTTKQPLDESTVVNNRVTVNGQEYIIDPLLKTGSSEPNYMQDCIRNGKYLIQKFNVGTNETALDESKWFNVSWDSASCISDKYYDEDDAAAKAKYDRLSSQIEAQDKKLQLELDNIETQQAAVKSERESVDKVIKDNVDKTFNTFA